MAARQFETIPPNARGRFGVPRLGYLAARASQLTWNDEALQLLEFEALGFSKTDGPRLLGMTESTTEEKLRQVHRGLLAGNGGHAVRIALWADLIDVPLDAINTGATVAQELLTNHQMRVLDVLSRGYGYRQTGEMLDRNYVTIDRTAAAAYARLGAQSLPHAVTIMDQIGILPRLNSLRPQYLEP